NEDLDGHRFAQLPLIGATLTQTGFSGKPDFYFGKSTQIFLIASTWTPVIIPVHTPPATIEMGREYHAIVVGAGQAGCAAACDLASAGCSVLLLDRRHFPRVKPCAGALTIKSLKALRYSVAPVVREVVSDFVAGNGWSEVNVLRGPGPVCALTVRSEFDSYCLQHTIEAGVEFKAISDWTGIEQSSSHVSISTSDGVFRAQFLIGADGANSQVRRSCTAAGWSFNGFAIELDCVYPGRKVDLEFDFGVVDGGYGWLFPKRDHVNIGLFTYKSGKA